MNFFNPGSKFGDERAFELIKERGDVMKGYITLSEYGKSTLNSYDRGKISIIRDVRIITRVELKEAKEFVDMFIKRKKVPISEVDPIFKNVDSSKYFIVSYIGKDDIESDLRDLVKKCLSEGEYKVAKKLTKILKDM